MQRTRKAPVVTDRYTAGAFCGGAATAPAGIPKYILGGDFIKLLFRCDGSRTVGAGHIMRCLSLADAGKRAGCDAVFVTASEDFTDIMRKRGYPVHAILTDDTAMDSERERFAELLERHRPDAVFVDSYFVTEGYLGWLLGFCRQIGARLVYLDDLAAFAYPCDVLLNYNIYGPQTGKTYRMLYGEHKTIQGSAMRQHPGSGTIMPGGGAGCPTLLLGPGYAPLREEFCGLPARDTRAHAGDILISTGGADPAHLAVAMLRALREGENRNPGTCVDAQGLRYHVVIGAMSTDQKELHALAEGMPYITLHEKVTHMCELMRRADVAISAAGSTLYELCAAQTPTITYVLADNQLRGAEGFAARGLMEYGGDVRKLGAEALAGELLMRAEALARDYPRRVELAAQMGELTDGRGADAVMEAVLRGQSGYGSEYGRREGTC